MSHSVERVGAALCGTPQAGLSFGSVFLQLVCFLPVLTPAVDVEIRCFGKQYGSYNEDILCSNTQEYDFLTLHTVNQQSFMSALLFNSSTYL